MTGIPAPHLAEPCEASRKRRLSAATGLIVACAIFAAQPSSGQTPGPGADPRIQEVVYDPAAVYPLAVYAGFAAIIEFGAQESIDSVIVGSAEGWQITPTSAANRLVVKPLPGAAPTNLIVVTDVRRYVIFLTANGSAQDVFVLKFSDDSPEAQQGSAQPSYRLAGDRSVRPRTIRDNGTDTRIVWDGTVELPAVFGIDENGEEMLLNGRMTSTGYLVEGVHDRLVFRMGKNAATARRTGPGKAR